MRVIGRYLLLFAIWGGYSVCSFAAILAGPDVSQATLEIYAGDRSPYVIPPYITGKFCEHLGSNIYKGMDAQILLNPTFADYKVSAGEENPDGGIRFHWDMEEIAKIIGNQAPNWGWPQEDVKGMIQDYKEGLACWWAREGKRAEVQVSPDVGEYGGRAQRIETIDAGQGIVQWIFLPLHRIRRFEFELSARSPDVTSLNVSFTSPDTKTFCAQSIITGISDEWTTFKGILQLPTELPEKQAYKFSVTTNGAGQFVLARILLRPSDHIEGADPDVIRLLKESHLPILRWPGGNFASTYHWQDGIGAVAKRPSLPNYAWGGIETNLFGTDEFIAFCRQVGCEPMICVNAGSGTPEEAAQWVEYCNGPITTPMGALRASHGHPQPYNVHLWEVGNELWGRWQYYWTTPKGYVDRYKRFAKAMLAADAEVRLYACGAPVMQRQTWNAHLFKEVAQNFYATTDHPLIGGDLSPEIEPLDVYRNYMALPDMLAEKYAALEQEMKRAGIQNPRMAITELQLFAGIEENPKPDLPKRLTSENLVRQSSVTEALYDILVYHEAIRLAPFVEMVTHSATVNHGAGLRKRHERVYAEPAHYAQTLFANFAHAVPVGIKVITPKEEAPMVLPDLRDVPSKREYNSIDALAAITDDKQLLISIVHRGTNGPIRLKISLQDFAAKRRAEITKLSADVPWASNSMKQPDKVIPANSVSEIKNNKLTLEIQPYTYLFVRIPGK